MKLKDIGNMPQSRTSSSILNGKVGLMYCMLSLIVGFVSRKIFLEYLGMEILGLNTTAQNLLGILNLSELGIGTAVAYTLYKPLQQHDECSINEIVALQGWLYRCVGCFVGVGGIMMMALLPFVFSESDLSLGYVYASFAVFLFSTLLTYFFNYKQVMLSADQRQYQIIIHYQSILLLKSGAQIVAVLLLPHPYVWWLLLHVVFEGIASWNLNRMIGKIYPNLTLSWREGRRYMERYPALLGKVKQILFHHIATFALTKSSSLVIFAFSNLSVVAIYTNYMMITSALQSLVHSLFTGIHAGVGNLVAGGDKERIHRVFEELFSVRFLLASVCSYCFLELVEPFVRVWIGTPYILPRSTLFLMTAILYVVISRQAVETYIAAHGMYQDVVAPIVETLLNVGLSCWFGYLWGMDGVLTGVLVSLVVVVLGWKPYFLFRYGLRQKISIYVWMYLRHLVCLVMTYVIVRWVILLMSLPSVTDYGTFLWVACVHFVIFTVLLTGLLWLVAPGMKSFILRICH